jgi:hypothetical protein
MTEHARALERLQDKALTRRYEALLAMWCVYTKESPTGAVYELVVAARAVLADLYRLAPNSAHLLESEEDLRLALGRFRLAEDGDA